MGILDEEGYVLGVINAIDLLFVLLTLAVVVAGVALITGAGDPATHTQTVTFKTTPQPEYVVEAIPVGRVPTDDITLITQKSVIVLNDGRRVATLRIRLRVTLQGDVPYFRDERLYVGRSLRLDFGTTIVVGTVIDMEPIENTA